tara:strand:- start:101 stop:367 length:267 start_codon:yes stop_codon:yes gene_type:complete
MPTFSEYTEVEVDINVTPIEFIECCSEKEIEELINELRSEGWLDGEQIPLLTHSIADEFYQNLNKIKQNRLALTAEEDEMLRKIASRF